MNQSQMSNEEKAQIPNALEIAVSFWVTNSISPDIQESIRRECRPPTKEDYDLIAQASQDLLYIGNDHKKTLELTQKGRNTYKWHEFDC